MLTLAEHPPPESLEDMLEGCIGRVKLVGVGDVDDFQHRRGSFNVLMSTHKKFFSALHIRAMHATLCFGPTAHASQAQPASFSREDPWI